MVAETQQRRRAGWVILGGLVVFITLMMVSMCRYPGGHDADVHAVGYSFWSNYWCDLARPVAFNGQSSDSLMPAAVAVGVLLLTLAAFWKAVPRGSKLMTTLGLVGLLGLVVILTTAGRGWIHWVAIAVGIVPNIWAIALLNRAVWRDRPLGGAMAWTGAVMLSVICINFAHFLAVALGFANWSLTLSAVQKGATVLFFGWVALGALTLFSGKLPDRKESESECLPLFQRNSRFE